MSAPSAIYDRPGVGMACATGVLLHVFLFRRGEWDLYTARILRLFAALWGSIALALKVGTTGRSHSFLDAFISSLYIATSVVVGLFSSILTYRIAFHRLNSFPGPFAARLSNIYATWLSIKNFQLYKEIQQLHKVYGDIVRVGPSELSIVNARAFHAIHSNDSPCVKGPWYNIEQPAISLHMTRDKNVHSRRRKTWDKAFNTKALRDYEPRVAKYTTQLLDRIGETQGMPFDASKWFNFYSFDVMGDLAFGKSFGMITTGAAHHFMKLIHKHMSLASAFSHLIWMFPLFREMPVLNKEDIDFQKWLLRQVEEREKNRPDVPDVFSWLLSDYEGIKNPTRQDRINLHADAQLIAVAGSDTTATSLTCLFFQLAINESACSNLQQEIDQYFATYNTPDHSSLSKLKYLQACIDETLRLFPPVPSGVQRMTPPSGLQVGETFIPGNTIVTVPSYTINRDKRFFDHPDDFIPERWTSKPELVKDASVFAPFSAGRYSCVGKQLGLMEIRYVTSQVLQHFNVNLANKDIEAAVLAGLKDRFTLAAHDLEVVFTARAPRQKPG